MITLKNPCYDSLTRKKEVASTCMPLINLRQGAFTMKEEWKDISNYEGLYQISNFGKVKSFHKSKEKILKISFNAEGYSQIRFCNNYIKESMKIHLLVWDHFGDEPRNGMKLQVDHIDEDKTNCAIWNLQLLTGRQNVTKEMLNKKTSSKYIGVTRDEKRNKWRSRITFNGKEIYLGRFGNEKDAAKAYQNKLKELLIIN